MTIVKPSLTELAVIKNLLLLLLCLKLQCYLIPRCKDILYTGLFKVMIQIGNICLTKLIYYL